MIPDIIPCGQGNPPLILSVLPAIAKIKRIAIGDKIHYNINLLRYKLFIRRSTQAAEGDGLENH